MDEKNKPKEKKKPLVSILIPCFNTETFVYGAINSALVQTHENIEVIVLNDGSTDESANICKSFGDKINYIENDKNMGIGYGRKRLVEESNGEFIVFCSADDILSNMFVETMLKEAEKHPGKIIYLETYSKKYNSIQISDMEKI